MSKLKTLYERLNTNLKSELKNSARKYDHAKRLKYKLMSSTLWYDLSVDDISSLMSYSGLYTHEVTAHDVLYGSKFITTDL